MSTEEIELHRYIEIIEYFDSETDPKELEMWRANQLITLMNELKQDKGTQLMVENCIILLNVLLEENLPDTYTNQLSYADRDNIRIILKMEVLV